MNSVIARLMIVLMLMPAFVCAMPVCASMSASEHTMATEHCADHDPSSMAADNVMLQADCANLDLPPTTAFFQFEKPSAEWAYVLVDNIVTRQQTYRTAFSSRGPPPSLSTHLPTLYLTTSRLRI